MPKRRPKEEAIQLLKDKYGENAFRDIECYVENHRTKIKATCSECGFKIDCRLDTLIDRGFACNNCAGKRHVCDCDEAEKIFKERFGDKLSMDVSTFTKFNEKPDVWCNDCGYHFDVQFRNLLKYTAENVCPACSGRRTANTSYDIVRKRVLEASDYTIDVIKETFKNTKDAELLCLNCGRIWNGSPYQVYRYKKGCAQCKNVLKYTYEQSKEKVDKKFNKTIDFFEEEYKNTYTDLHFYCKICGHIWVSTIHTLLHSQGCLKCTLKSFEAVIMSALDKKGVEYYHDKALEGSNYNGSNQPLRADFRFKDYPIVIETDGKQHFVAVEGLSNHEETKARDKHKNKYCKERGLILIRITSSPTKEWGSEKHLTLEEGLKLINEGISSTGEVNLDLFRQYDFNRE